MTLMKLRSGLLDYFWVMEQQQQPHPKAITRNFQNVIGKRFLGDIFWSPKYIGIVKCFFVSKLATITQLDSLFVLYFWSSNCRCSIKLLMEWAQFINNYQKSTLEGPRKKQFVLQSCFVNVYYLGILI